MAWGSAAEIRQQMLQELDGLVARNSTRFTAADLRKQMGVPPTDTTATGRWWTAFRWMQRHDVVQEVQDEGQKRHRTYTVSVPNLHTEMEGAGMQPQTHSQAQTTEEEVLRIMEEIRDLRTRLRDLVERL